MRPQQHLLLAAASLTLAGCVARGESSGTPRNEASAVTTATAYRARGGACQPAFTGHTLEHTTTPRQGDRTVYDSNGAGLAVGDLDEDGRLDLVLGNLAGPAQVMLNRGGFTFQGRTLVDALGLEERGTRAVQAVDANADGHLDLAFTHTRGGLSLWLGDGRGGFKPQALPSVSTPAYTMLWDDLDADGDLDLVTASYDAMLEAESKDFLFSSGGGVVVYTNTAGSLRPARIAGESQSLAVALFDVNADGKRDLIVGNDFAVPDMIWLRTSEGWQKAQPFARTTKNTMGFTVGDTDNDGNPELFATDMKPDFKDREALAAWMPFMEKTFQKLQYKSLQRAENVLQRQVAPGKFQNVAYEQALDATGWSWSAQFGDLDNNGFQDLYVVNGMIDTENLKYLPGSELIERNRAYRNDGGRFALDTTWGLGSTASGRSMAMADLDNDGRLDIVVNNLGKPAQVFENNTCGGSSLTVDLGWPSSQNTRALGASVTLRSSAGTMYREVVSQSGYLTGLTNRLHFGFPEGTTLESLEVVWPDGRQSTIKNPSPDAILRVQRSQP